MSKESETKPGEIILACRRAREAMENIAEYGCRSVECGEPACNAIFSGVKTNDAKRKLGPGGIFVGGAPLCTYLVTEYFRIKKILSRTSFPIPEVRRDALLREFEGIEGNLERLGIEIETQE